MSIWDHVKKTQKPPQPAQVELSPDGKELRILWEDGQKTSASAQLLRQFCPCAECVDEWTHQRTLNQSAISEDISIVERRQVGNYALGFRFSDGHQTGIFTWVLLRDPAHAATAPKPV